MSNISIGLKSPFDNLMEMLSQFSFAYHSAVSSGAWTKLMDSNKFRCGVIFASLSSTQYQFAFTNPPPSNNGITVGANQSYQSLSYQQIGPLIAESIWFQSGAATLIAYEIFAVFSGTHPSLGLPQVGFGDGSQTQPQSVNRGQGNGAMPLNRQMVNTKDLVNAIQSQDQSAISNVISGKSLSGTIAQKAPIQVCLDPLDANKTIVTRKGLPCPMTLKEAIVFISNTAVKQGIANANLQKAANKARALVAGKPYLTQADMESVITTLTQQGN